MNDPVRPDRIAPLWRNGDFLLLWGGQTVSALGGGISSLSLPLLALAITHSPAQAGFVGALRLLLYVALTLPAGALVDRWDRKRVMVLCNAGLGLGVGSIPLALALGRLTVAQLYVNSAVAGMCSTFLYAAERAALPRIVSPAQLPAAMARNEATESVVTLLSPSLGGILYGAGRALPFAADAVSYTVAALSLLRIRREFQGERSRAPRALRVEIREGFAWLWRQPLLRAMGLLQAGYFFVFGFGGSDLLVIVLARRHGAAPAAIGLIFAAGGAGGLLGALVAPWVRRRAGVGRVVIGVHWLFALLWPLYALAPSPLALGLVEAAVAFVDQIHDVAWVSHRTARIPDTLQGRVGGVNRLLQLCLRPFGLALGGVLIARAGAPTTILLAACGLVALAIATTANGAIRAA